MLNYVMHLDDLEVEYFFRKLKFVIADYGKEFYNWGLCNIYIH